MPKPSIPADDSAEDNTPAPDAADNKTADTGNDLDDASKSDDTSSTDDDKKSTDTKTSDDSDDAPASTFDEDLDDWIKTRRKGDAPITDEDRAAYQDLRNEQRDFHNERQAKKDAEEFGKTVKDSKPDDTSDDDDDDDLDPLEKRQNKIEADLAEERNTRLQSEFFVDNKVTPEQGKAIVEIAREKFNAPTSDAGKQRAFDYWSSVDALPDLLDLAKARLAQADNSVVADEAAREEREKIERESNAKSPGRSASQHSAGDDGDINSDEARKKRFEARYNKS